MFQNLKRAPVLTLAPVVVNYSLQGQHQFVTWTGELVTAGKEND